MTKTQWRILKALDEPDMLEVQTPSVIAFNLDISQTWVNQQLSELVDQSLVEKVEKGKYRITEAGRREINDR
jgi:Mn-dependent DtxR family transcriptional regulator